MRRCRLPGGAEISCDMGVPYEAMAWLGCEEPDDLWMLRRLLRPGETFVDCGANVGLWSLVAARSVGPSGKVFAFEPNPRTHARLARHIAHNALADIVTAFPSCAGAVVGTLPFLCQPEHNVSHVASAGDAGATPLPVTTLDAALGDAPVHGIKIDVEGHEFAVLLGAGKLLQRSRLWICVEFNTTLLPSPRLGDWDVHRHLAALGYRCRRFVEAAGAGALDDAWTTRAYENLLYFHA
jgi:FkbM family methyltransferase